MNLCVKPEDIWAGEWCSDNEWAQAQTDTPGWAEMGQRPRCLLGPREMFTGHLFSASDLNKSYFEWTVNEAIEFM